MQEWIPQDNDIIIRQSTINSMWKCPASVGYQLAEADGVLPVFSEAVHFGTTLHWMIESRLNGEYTSLQLMNPTRVEEFAAEASILDANVNLYEVASQEEINSFCEEVVNAFQLWDQNFLRFYGQFIDLNKGVVEKEMYAHIGNVGKRRIVLYGTPDWVVPYGPYNTLFDWKSSKTNWKEGKAALAIQKPLYLFLTEQNLGFLPDKSCFLVYDRAKKKWNEHWTDTTQQEIDSAVETAVEFGRMIAKKVFPPQPVQEVFGQKRRGWWCSAKYCSAWNACTYKYLSDGVDENTVATVRWK